MCMRTHTSNVVFSYFFATKWQCCQSMAEAVRLGKGTPKINALPRKWKEQLCTLSHFPSVAKPTHLQSEVVPFMTHLMGTITRSAMQPGRSTVMFRKNDFFHFSFHVWVCFSWKGFGMSFRVKKLSKHFQVNTQASTDEAFHFRGN